MARVSDRPNEMKINVKRAIKIEEKEPLSKIPKDRY
jgi:hypothetical protein